MLQTDSQDGQPVNAVPGSGAEQDVSAIWYGAQDDSAGADASEQNISPDAVRQGNSDVSDAVGTQNYTLTGGQITLYGVGSNGANYSSLTEEEKRYFRSVRADMDETTATLAIHKMSDFLSRYYGRKVIILLRM